MDIAPAPVGLTMYTKFASRLADFAPKAFTTNDSLKESHAREIKNLLHCSEGKKLWTQERIAKAKRVSVQTVNFRIQFSDFPKSVIDEFSTNVSLAESHAREIRQILHCRNFEPWRTFESSARATELPPGPRGDNGSKLFARATDFAPSPP